MSDAPPQPGETWAYRAQARTPTCPLVPATVLAIGGGRNHRVHIQFLASEDEGQEQWVPPERLLVRWDERDPWLRDEQAFAAARAASRLPPLTPEYQAASLVLANSPRPGGIRLGFGSREGAIVRVTDVAYLARVLGLDAARLRQEPLAFVDRHGTYVAPWPVARGLARRIAELYAERILTRIGEEVTMLRQEALLGRTTVLRDGTTHTVPAASCGVTLQLRERVFTIVRAWCGEPAVVRFDRTAQLEAEITRLRGLLAAEDQRPTPRTDDLPDA